MGFYISTQHRFVLKIIFLVIFYVWAGAATCRYKYALIMRENPDSYYQNVVPINDDINQMGSFLCGFVWPIYWVGKGIYLTTAWADVKPINTVEAP